MNKLLPDRNHYGVMGVLIYILLSNPMIREVFFGGGAKILDIYSGELAATDGGAFSFFTQYTLYVPYMLNKYIFTYFDIFNINVLVIATCIPVVYRYFSFSKGWLTFFLLAFLFFPVPLVALSTFNKEYVLVICLYFSYGYLSNGETRSNWFLFFLYAFFLRAYLVFVPYILSSKKNIFHYAVMFFFAALLLSTNEGNEVLYKLFNRRLSDKGFDANSEIEQTVYVKSLFDIGYMLMEVLPQILLPIFYNFGIKSMFFQMYIWTLLFMAVRYRNVYSNVILGLFFLYVVLDPDLGAFIRHISSFFIFFPMVAGLMVVNNEN